MIKSLRGWEFDELEEKSTETKNQILILKTRRENVFL